MVEANQKQFAVYVLAQVFPILARIVGGERQFMTELSTNYPGLDVNQLTGDNVQRNQWAEKSARIIIDHLANKSGTAEYRATA